MSRNTKARERFERALAKVRAQIKPAASRGRRKGTAGAREKYPPLSDVEAEQRGIRVDRDGLVRCRVCGCTEREPCGSACGWVEVDLCSSCHETLEAMLYWAEVARRVNMTALLREFNWERNQ
jgi:hypothetical protein